MAIYTHTLMECFNKAIQVAHKELAVFTGATASSAGAKGAVPAPASGDIVKFLRSDGTWAEIYAIGDVILTMTPANPGLRYGGTWERIGHNRMLLGADSAHLPGTTGGADDVTLTLNELPSHSHSGTTNSAGEHTHSRGTMNITGSFGTAQQDYVRPGGYTTGAFKATTYTGKTDSGGATDTCGYYTFNAADSWTGNTSEAGGHVHDVTTTSNGAGQSFSVKNRYLAVYVWQRTA